MANNQHDIHYRRLFSNPHMVRALFEGILPDELHEQVNLNTLEKLPTNFISDKNRDRLADGVWQIRRRDGDMLYLLILLEHQSKPDKLMSVRVMGYTALLYEDLVRSKHLKRSQKLPAILPLVLYSGRRSWRAALEVADLLEPAPEGLQPYQPNMRYLLVDEGALVKQGDLPEENLAALLFRLEHNPGLEPTIKMMQTVLRLTTSPEFTEVRSAFTLWLNHLLLPRHQPELTNKLAQIEDLSETIAMTATTYRNWGQDLREAVRQEVRQESTVETLSMLITHKFGSLPDWATARLKQASQQDLNRWTLRILDVQRIEDVFH